MAVCTSFALMGGGTLAAAWQEDRADQGRRGVAYQYEHARSPPDTGQGFRSASNGSNPSAAMELIRVLCGIEPKPIATRLTASTPAACDEIFRLWGEYT